MGWHRRADGAVLAVAGFAGRAWAADAVIPYRAEEAGLGMQAALAYGSVVILLALAVVGLVMLRKRLGARLPGKLAADAGLRSIASLRLPQQTLVHVVAYRNREIVFAQSGDTLLELARFRCSAGCRDGGA